MKPPRLLIAASLIALGACATARGRAPKVDLTPAREALESAREAGAAERAKETFTRAQGHFNEAEALLAEARGSDAPERARQAEWLARLATVEARCAASLARAEEGRPRAAQRGASASQEAERVSARLRRAEEEQRRLEGQIALLRRELELTETEVIRAKARLKGIETKAEASSTIAEARTLLHRLAGRKVPSATLARCQEQIDRAEQLLKGDNYGAAIFFASKAQDTAMKALQPPEDPRRGRLEPAPVEPPPPRAQYAVRAPGARIRGGPGPTEPVLATAPKGATLRASAVRGDWVKVTYGEVTGWVHRSRLE